MTAVHIHLVVLAAQAAMPAALPERHAQAVLDRMLATEPFVESAEHRALRSKTGRYFSRQEHARLHGNPLLGYLDIGTFAWSGRLLAFDGIRGAHRSARGITGAAWAAAVAKVAARHGLELSQGAHLRLEGGCVAAVIDPGSNEPVPGVLLELRLKSPSGTLLYRVGMGKASVEDAMGAALDLVISFARSLETKKGAGIHAR